MERKRGGSWCERGGSGVVMSQGPGADFSFCRHRRRLCTCEIQVPHPIPHHGGQHKELVKVVAYLTVLVEVKLLQQLCVHSSSIVLVDRVLTSNSYNCNCLLAGA